MRSQTARVVSLFFAIVLFAGGVALSAARSTQESTQIGSRRVTGGSASFSKTEQPGDSPVVLSVDDGSYETAIGVVNQSQTLGTQAVFLNRLTIPTEYLPFTLDSVSILFPTSTDDGPTGLMSGQHYELLVYEDPDSTGVPANTRLRVDQSFLLQPSNSLPQVVRLDLPVVIQSGDIWVGFTNFQTSLDNLPVFPAAVDTSSPSQARSWVFFNDQTGEHFNGPLDTADLAVTFQGNWLIRASGQPGGFTCVTWGAPAAARGGTLPPPLNAHICDDVPDPLAEEIGRGPRDTLQGYNVYRSSTPGVQTTPANRFASVPPSQTAVGSSVASGGSFFVVTAQYDTGESGPSNEISVLPATITSVKVKSTKLNIRGTNFTNPATVFLDGIPFVSPPTTKQGGARVVQKGNLITGQSIGAYLAANGGSARLTVRNTSGTFATQTITGP